MNIFILEDDLSPLFKRLQKGQIIKGRIVYVLDRHRYLLRIMGRNLVMQSNMKFNRFQEVLLQIRQIDSKIQLRFVDPQREFLKTGKNRQMNLLIE